MEDKVNEPKAVHHYWSHRSWVWILGAIIVAFLIFIAGAKLGSHARKFVDYYGGPGMMGGQYGVRHFGGPGMMGGQYFAASSSDTGTISKISGNQLTVNFDNGVSQNVIVSGSTNILKSGSVIKLTDLKLSDKISVRGYTDSSGNLQAIAISVQ